VTLRSWLAAGSLVRVTVDGKELGLALVVHQTGVNRWEVIRVDGSDLGLSMLCFDSELSPL
jgi:hypothetical protein